MIQYKIRLIPIWNHLAKYTKMLKASGWWILTRGLSSDCSIMVFWIVISLSMSLGLMGLFLMCLELRDWWVVGERIEWHARDFGEDNEYIQRLLPEPVSLSKGERILTFHSTEKSGWVFEGWEWYECSSEWSRRKLRKNGTYWQGTKHNFSSHPAAYLWLYDVMTSYGKTAGCKDTIRWIGKSPGERMHWAIQ